MNAFPELRGAVLFFAVVTTVPSHAGWREEVRALRAGSFPPPSDLSARYVFGWSGIEAAEAEVTLRRGPNGNFTGTVRGGTKGAARTLYKIDADYRTEVSAADFRSRGFTLTERYRSYRVEEKAEFPTGGARAWRETTRKGAKPPKWKNFYVPGLRDMAAAVLLARSQPLKKGDRLTLAVFPGDWMYCVRLKVGDREKINWRGQRRNAIRVALEIDRINKDYTLTPHRKFHHGTIWVSDDDLRIPLRIEVKVFVGSVFAELVEVKAEG
jgi:hypothetical protein